MSLKKYGALIFVLLISTFSVSAQAYTVRSVDIGFLRTYNSYAILTYNPSGTNQENCTHAGAKYYAYIEMSGNSGKALYSAALAAFLSNRKIRLGLSGCHTWGSGTVPKVMRLDIYKEGS